MDIRKNIAYIMDLKLNNERVIAKSELATICNVQPAAVTNWCKGEAVPNIEIIPLICTTFHVTLNEFFGIDNSEIISSEHSKLINAYDSHTELQQAIKRLLEID